MMPTAWPSHTQPLGEQSFLAYLLEKSALRLFQRDCERAL